MDGNKRAALAAMGAFIGANGRKLEADQTELFAPIVSAASSQINEETVARWIAAHLQGDA